MRRADENLESIDEQSPGELPGRFCRATTAASRFRVAVLIIALGLFAVAAVACAPGSGFSPAGAQNPANSSEVTVPDDISSLDREEVELRLGRLLGDDNPGGQAAPDIAPTETPGEPTLEEILELLNSGTPSPSLGEIAVSISPGTLAGLERPILSIKIPPSHGSATVIAPNQILYSPDGTGDGTDAFEYELFDGDRLVVSQVIEVRG